MFWQAAMATTITTAGGTARVAATTTTMTMSTAILRGARPQYVQDALRAGAAQLAEAIRLGAKILVCGGRDMAQGVGRALEDILGPRGLRPAMLKAGGRYVEDVC